MGEDLDNRYLDTNLQNKSFENIEISKEELRKALKKYRKKNFSQEEIFSIQEKIIKNKDSIHLFHFTDIWYLKNILSKGISWWSETVCSSINDAKTISWKEYSDALATYRWYNEDEWLKRHRKSQDNYLNEKLASLNRFLKNWPKNNIHHEEFEIICNFYKRYLKTRSLDSFEEEEKNNMHEIFTRIDARRGYFTLNYNQNHLQSSMNVCLIFDKEDVYSKTDIFGMERWFDLRTKYSIKGKSKIKWIMIYKINLPQVIDAIIETTTSVNDIMPIYDYDGNILWPK